MTPGWRKLALVAHVASSVGWLGAVAAFLALAVLGLTSQDAPTVRGVYLAMAPAAWLVLVPLGLASLATGLVQALSTKWGLFRHYWVLAKLSINLFAFVVLLLYTQTLDSLARTAEATASSSDPDALRSVSPVLHAAAALLLLLTATGLSIYKPRGTTPYGRRARRGQQPRSRT